MARIGALLRLTFTVVAGLPVAIGGAGELAAQMPTPSQLLGGTGELIRDATARPDLLIPGGGRRALVRTDDGTPRVGELYGESGPNRVGSRVLPASNSGQSKPRRALSSACPCRRV